MEFSVWDYGARIEVRLSDQMNDKIHGIKTERRVLCRETTTRRQLGWCKWKKPHIRLPFYMVKEVPLIADAQSSPYHRIGQRLFMKIDRHTGRTPKTHKPFVAIKDLHTIHQLTKIPVDQLEASVISVRNGSSKVELNARFPITANADWAWLFGFYYACGGLVTRDRSGKHGSIWKEHLVRLTLTEAVFEKKLAPILERLGYKPDLKTIGYVKHGTHVLDKQCRKGVGNTPRKFVYLPTVIRAVMEHFGLYVDIPRQVLVKHNPNSLHGRAPISSRRFKLSIPTWVRQYTKEFIEGFINGGASSHFYRRPIGFSRTVDLRVGFTDPADTAALINFFKEELGKLGITGTAHPLHTERRNVCWYGFCVHNKQSLTRLHEIFDIQNPVVRARLNVHSAMNTLLYEICRRLSSTEILIVGALIEKPRSEQELANIFRLRNDQVTNSLNRLSTVGLVAKQSECWRLYPADMKHMIVTELKKRDEERLANLVKLGDSFFSRCNKCGDVVADGTRGECDCGGVYEPVERSTVLRRFAPRNGVRIAQILKEEIPQEVN